MSKLAIITGGGQGIGRELVRHFIGAGWRVAALDVDAEALKELGALLPGGALLTVPADVGSEDVVQTAFARLWQWQTDAGEPQGADLLVNNAGIADPYSGPVEDLSLADWRRWQDSHLTAAFLCTRAAVPGLRQRCGCIVNIASTRALQSEPDCEAYAAAKGGIVAFTHALAISLGPAVRANVVLPGWIETGPLQKKSKRHETDVREIDRKQHPVGRIGEATDVAELVAYLAAAGFVTGQQFIVDGGMTRKMIYAE